PDLLALQHLDVVGDAADDEHVRELRPEAVVELRVLALRRLTEGLRLLAAVGREEACVVGVLAERQRDEALFRELELTALTDLHLGRALRLDLAHGFVLVQRQILDRATGLRTDDVRAPPELREAVGDT